MTARFEARLLRVEGSTILRLPKEVSEKLPSRGQVAVRGTFNRRDFRTVLEPDGRGGHWMRIDGRLRRGADGVAALEIEVSPDWPEPNLPTDFERALAVAPQKIRNLWATITPMARWEWVRWINATNNPETRRRRVEVSISKMNSGKRRPCCFNLASCTDPNLSRNARLIETGS